MKTFLTFFAVLILLSAGAFATTYQKRKWFKCGYCSHFFSDCGDTKRETPAKFEPTCERCPDCQAEAENDLNRLIRNRQ